MRIKKAVLWYLVTSQEHPFLTQDDKKIEALTPLVSALFPGINYYSITGFSQVMHDCVIPALKKQHPDLVTMTAAQVRPDVMAEVSEVMPSRGYEWQDDQNWKARFRAYLIA